MRIPAMMSTGSVIVALNGALQKRLLLPKGTPLVPGNVHRIQEVQVGVGGKGQDVAIALSCLGYEQEQLKIAQFLGQGPEGDQVHDLLQDRLGSTAMELTVRPATGLRTCTSLVADDHTTELVEPSGVISEQEMSDLLTKLEKLDGGKAVPAICIMGSMPPGCGSTTYAEIYKRVAGPDTLCAIDSLAGLEHLLEVIASEDKRGPTIFKVNASELCTLAGVTKSNNEIDGIKTEELLSAIKGFFAKFGPNAIQAVSAIAITDGKHPAHLAVLQDGKEFSLYQVPVATLPKGRTLFPIGAGDAVAAGTLAAWQCLVVQQTNAFLPPNVLEVLKEHKVETKNAGETKIPKMLTALAFGLACGSASCLQEENSVLDVKDVLGLFNHGKPTFVSSHSI